jgi:hypothetical protein
MQRNNRNKKKPGKRRGNYRVAGVNTFSNFEKKGITFLDPHKFVTLRYVETFQYTLLTTVADQQRMRLNSLYDPNQTGTGQQPYGFDQLATLYNFYRVWNTRWKIVFSPAAVTYHLTVIPTNAALSSAITDQATFEAACRSPFAKSWAQGASGLSHCERGFMSLPKLNGRRPEEYKNEERTAANFTGSPTEILDLYIALYNPNAVTLTANVLVEMEFETEVFDPILLPASTLAKYPVSDGRAHYEMNRRNNDPDSALLSKLRDAGLSVTFNSK